MKDWYNPIMTPRTFSLVAGGSYLVIFVAAMYANFFVLDSLLQDPVGTVEQNGMHVRFGALAFLVAAVFDVFVAWALYVLYKDHVFSSVSTCFRVIHAAIMGAAVFALVPVLELASSEAILTQVSVFNTLWLIGLFFFGFHLMLLARIVKHIRIIPLFLMLAGIMYIVDTSAHFVLPNYDTYAETFLMLVAVPAILGEMAFALWLLYRGGKASVTP